MAAAEKFKAPEAAAAAGVEAVNPAAPTIQEESEDEEVRLLCSLSEITMKKKKLQSLNVCIILAVLICEALWIHNLLTSLFVLFSRSTRVASRSRTLSWSCHRPTSPGRKPSEHLKTTRTIL